MQGLNLRNCGLQRMFLHFLYGHMLLMIRGERLWLIKAIQEDKIII